jgi:hypothetical protein
MSQPSSKYLLTELCFSAKLEEVDEQHDEIIEEDED